MNTTQLTLDLVFDSVDTTKAIIAKNWEDISTMSRMLDTSCIGEAEYMLTYNMMHDLIDQTMDLERSIVIN
jgi:hypothetical protein